MLFLFADQTHNVYLYHAGRCGDDFCLRGYTQCSQIHISSLSTSHTVLDLLHDELLLDTSLTIPSNHRSSTSSVAEATRTERWLQVYQLSAHIDNFVVVASRARLHVAVLNIQAFFIFLVPDSADHTCS